VTIEASATSSIFVPSDFVVVIPVLLTHANAVNANHVGFLALVISSQSNSSSIR
jgi:hypothetical protein